MLNRNQQLLDMVVVIGLESLDLLYVGYESSSTSEKRVEVEIHEIKYILE